jgi:hypothetical protein
MSLGSPGEWIALRHAALSQFAADQPSLDAIVRHR